MPVDSLDELAALKGVKFASMASPAETNSGATTSAGDAAQVTDQLRMLFGVNGAGVTIGIMSDSWDKITTDTTSAAQDVASGDLPPNVVVAHDDRPLSQLNRDEGRAMAQIVYDIAPGASQVFSSVGQDFNFPSGPVLFQTRFANRIRELARPTEQGGYGAKIIVDDWIMRRSPMFQDGFVAQAVSEVAGNNVVYVTSADNFARESYESAFHPGPTIATLEGRQETAHVIDSASGSYRQHITVGVGEQFSLYYQWDEPFFSLVLCHTLIFG